MAPGRRHRSLRVLFVAILVNMSFWRSAIVLVTESGKTDDASSLLPLKKLRKAKAFRIVILTMNRLHSLKRLVGSLMDEGCQYGNFGEAVNIEFHIDRPKDGGKDSWFETISWASNLTWPYGEVNAVVAKENLGLRDSWFNAWRPDGDDERAIILEDDVEVSKLWYLWVNGAYDAYGQNSDVAGFSLQRQNVIPLTDGKQRKGGISANDNEPFLYR